MMFELTVLGCQAPFPAAGGACSGYLLSVGERKILIDCGSGVLANLERLIDYRRGSLDAVILTHLHHDHISDFWLMRYAMAFSDNSGPDIPVYLPNQPRALFDMLPFQGVQLRPIHPGDTNIAGLQLNFFQTQHPIVCFGIRVDYEGARFVYTADTAYHDRLVDVSRGADLLLCECSLRDEDARLRDRGHMTSSDAGRLAANAGVRQLVLTHFWPDHQQTQLIEEAKANCRCPVDAAAIGQTWKIDRE